MDYSKLDAALASALSTAAPLRGVRRGKTAAPGGSPRFQVFVEFAQNSAEAVQLAQSLQIDAPQSGHCVITANLNTAQIETASQHPAVRRLTLTRMLRPVKK